jgi:hypothetical protein
MTLRSVNKHLFKLLEVIDLREHRRPILKKLRRYNRGGNKMCEVPIIVKPRPNFRGRKVVESVVHKPSRTVRSGWSARIRNIPVTLNILTNHLGSIKIMGLGKIGEFLRGDEKTEPLTGGKETSSQIQVFLLHSLVERMRGTTGKRCSLLNPRSLSVTQKITRNLKGGLDLTTGD